MPKVNTQKFLLQHPFCIFCGGDVIATTREHSPPKAFFQFRIGPEGFEFPACSACNNGTSDDDLLVAMMGRLDPFGVPEGGDDRTLGLFKAVASQHGGLLDEMFNISTREARQFARQMGIRPERGVAYREMGMVRVTGRINDAVRVLAGKLSKAIYYRQNGRVFPANGEILFHWFTNKTVYLHGSVPVLDILDGLEVEIPKISRSGKDLSEQFDYRYAASADKKLFVIGAVFGRSFGFTTILSLTAGQLSKWLESLEAGAQGDPGALSLL